MLLLILLFSDTHGAFGPFQRPWQEGDGYSCNYERFASVIRRCDCTCAAQHYDKAGQWGARGEGGPLLGRICHLGAFMMAITNIGRIKLTESREILKQRYTTEEVF
ncbi:hypothetical protein CLAFUW4_20006 [Fulvia fulva]|uniref:uncharacterized protein n=1 Tax=Passalora fulva TaxID=5499 RepID=UPI0028528EE2|nr:uncharacterized protein CLAFUR5_20006 [Fulvia fulva]KAK4636305.1 hypothetical protein CLAFUR4_20006 [Fulvia fulva]KAK4637211.1 hypothetical protein CLAFUR0_20006 [Fulvia fulva]WMI38757.1 hypothetical protein CLAFUR5_20006 [Fulvia fulva]WPV08511.1 hypothetical protein CLAFUW4_20006 [Fulvia fulva]WPV25078.1 hypothetical protein CLAFUW7_20006 [Fulvia fulva]